MWVKIHFDMLAAVRFTITARYMKPEWNTSKNICVHWICARHCWLRLFRSILLFADCSITLHEHIFLFSIRDVTSQQTRGSVCASTSRWYALISIFLLLLLSLIEIYINDNYSDRNISLSWKRSFVQRELSCVSECFPCCWSFFV